MRSQAMGSRVRVKTSPGQMFISPLKVITSGDLTKSGIKIATGNDEPGTGERLRLGCTGYGI